MREVLKKGKYFVDYDRSRGDCDQYYRHSYWNNRYGYIYAPR